MLLATLPGLTLEGSSAAELGWRLERALSPRLAAADVVDGVRNVFLFAGWGLVWGLTAAPGRPLRTLALATGTGATLSLAVETLQLLSPVRTASILDVLSNGVGALLGAAVTLWLLDRLAAARGARSFVGVPAFLFAGAYGAAAALEAVLPGLRQAMLPDAAGGPLARLATSAAAVDWRVGPVGTTPLQLLLFLPAGAFLHAALVERGLRYRSALAVTVPLAVVAALLFEILRGASGQPMHAGAALAHAAGGALGAAAAFRWLPGLTTRLHGPARPLALACAYAAVLPLWRWRPFSLRIDPAEIASQFAWIHLVPLQALAMKFDLFSASVVAVGFLLHVPLGALLAVWPVRATGPLRGVWPGVYLVIALETGQIFVAGRFFDVTDILIGAAGLAAGWVFVRRAGFRRHGEMLPGVGPRGVARG